MSDFEMTQEEIQMSINAAFDSVNLINDLNAKESLTTEELDTVDYHETRQRGKYEGNEYHVELWSLEHFTGFEINRTGSSCIRS